MGRPRSHKATATEAKIKETLQGIKDGIYKSAYDASKQLNLNNKTLNNRLTKKTKSRVEAREDQQNLSKAEEQALVR